MTMETRLFTNRSRYQWVVEPVGRMNVPAIIFADETLIKAMDEKVYEQATNVASLPGIVKASFAMPDAHWGYGFPIGGVAAFDPQKGGVISAGGVGFDIACGVRTITTGLAAEQVLPLREKLADLLARKIPAGVGSRGRLHLGRKEMDDMLAGGAKWAVERGFGTQQDLQRIEEHGAVSGADPAEVSDQAKKRQEDEVGTLGSGNHYMEVQQVADIYDDHIADVFGLKKGQIVVSLHCGSRGLGHQVATEFLKRMVTAAASYGINLPERDLACAPIESPVGRQYIGAMRAAINCALANRQILTHLLRQIFAELFPKAELKLLYDVSHNTCKEETHLVDGRSMRLFVHRKGATRSFGPGDPSLPPEFRSIGQPVIIGGTMGTSSYILVGTAESMSLSFGSSCHGAGRSMSRTAATKKWNGKEVIKNLASRGIIIRSQSLKGTAEEAPGAYKDVSEVVETAHQANLSRKVARLEPLICVKG
jgi:tRNA-splicing ligase RtcB